MLGSPAHPGTTLLGIGGVLPQAALPVQIPGQDSWLPFSGMWSGKGKYVCVRERCERCLLWRTKHMSKICIHVCAYYVCCHTCGCVCSRPALLNLDWKLTLEDDLVGAVKGSWGLSCKKSTNLWWGRDEPALGRNIGLSSFITASDLCSTLFPTVTRKTKGEEEEKRGRGWYSSTALYDNQTQTGNQSADLAWTRMSWWSWML